MFETRGQIDGKLLYELNKRYIDRRRYLFYPISVFVLAMLILLILQRKTALAILYGVLLALLLTAYVYFPKKWVRIQVQRWRDMGLTPPIPSHTRFTEEGVESINDETGKRMTVSYDKLVRLVETPQVCALYTAGQLFMLVFKDQLSESQREEFRSFLRTKPTQIKKL